jgi:small GTP-binding protein
MEDAFEESSDEIQTHDVYKYRVSYITQKDLNLIFLFVTGLTDKKENIEKELKKCKAEFMDLFGDILDHKFDEKTFEVFDPTIDSIHRNLRPKLSLVGFSGVGKTTITKLIKAEEIPMQHIPTITGDIATIKIGKLHFHLWDFAGQEQFSYLWTNFIKGSDAVLLITDSTLENVEKSKFFLELIREQAKHAHTAVIGNKQDLSDAMKPDQIEDILGLKTYSMTAIDPANRDKMIQIIADILEMNAEVSPLLQPLLERDRLTHQAEDALENAEFEKAAKLFEQISDLCIDLGDDSLSKEFYQKADKIKSMLTKVSPEKAEVPLEEDISTEKEKPEARQDVIERKPPRLPKVKEEAEYEEEKEIEEPTSKLTEMEEKFEKPKIKPLPPERKPPKLPQEEEKEGAPSLSKEKLGLKLNPEDFMIKKRPKTVANVPKDAKSKLKTSAFAQVSNPPESSDLGAVSEKDVGPPPGPPKQTPSEEGNPPESKEQEQSASVSTTSLPSSDSKSLSTSKKELEETLMDLKIKKAKISKMALDFEMQELSGEITAEELEMKKSRLSKLENNIKAQISELQELLDSD